MARVKRGFKARRRRNKVLKLAKGYRGARSKLFRSATEAVDRALNYAFRDRRVKKRDFRSLWIVRINAASRINGLSYSKFIFGLKRLMCRLIAKYWQILQLPTRTASHRLRRSPRPESSCFVRLFTEREWGHVPFPFLYGLPLPPFLFFSRR